MDSYFDRIHEFRHQLRVHKVRYDILKNLDQIGVKLGNYEILYLIVNSFLLENDYIKNTNQSRYKYAFRSGDAVYFDKKQTLVLKKRGKNALHVVKYLKDNLDIGLKRAKEITDDTPCVIKNGLPLDKAERYKKEIEELEATCFLKTDYFESKDGSTIHIKNGQLIFNSSKAFIPTFYITSVLNQKVGMATQGEFSGNTYYLPVNHQLTAIETQEFYKKYINPFLTQILEHED